MIGCQKSTLGLFCIPISHQHNTEQIHMIMYCAGPGCDKQIIVRSNCSDRIAIAVCTDIASPPFKRDNKTQRI
jgi:hypothetical protein